MTGPCPAPRESPDPPFSSHRSAPRPQHPASTTRILEGLSSCLHKTLSQGMGSTPCTSRGFISLREHLLYTCREGTVKTQSQEAVSADNKGSANCLSGWGDGRIVPRQEARLHTAGKWEARVTVCPLFHHQLQWHASSWIR